MILRYDASMHHDNRPRIPYILPDGTEGRVIFHHGDRVPDEISFAPAGGGPVVMIKLSPSYDGPRVLPC